MGDWSEVAVKLGVVPDRKCEMFIERCRSQEPQYAPPGFNDPGVELYPERMTVDTGLMILPEVNATYDAAVKMGHMKEEFIFDSFFLKNVPVGASHFLHSDNCKPSYEDFDTWVHDNRTPQRAITGLFYLNDDFVGGELEFPYHNVRIKPQKGMMIAFASSLPHRVDCVTEGNRYTLCIWLKRHGQ